MQQLQEIATNTVNAMKIVQSEDPRQREAFYEAIVNIRVLADNILKEADWIDINQD